MNQPPPIAVLSCQHGDLSAGCMTCGELLHDRPILRLYSTLCSNGASSDGSSDGSSLVAPERRAKRLSRFSWALRILSTSLRRFSNVFLFFAILLPLFIDASRHQAPKCAEITGTHGKIPQLERNRCLHFLINKVRPYTQHAGFCSVTAARCLQQRENRQPRRGRKAGKRWSRNDEEH